MKLTTITEENVCRAHAALVKSAVSQLRGIEREEALALAWIGLLYAIRTWRAGAGEFEDYARKRIQEQVELFKRCLSQQRRVESPISLDMKVRPDGECTTTFADMIAFVEWDQTTVDVGLFIRSLAPDARMFVRLRMRTCTNSEIAQIMHITPAQVAELHRKVMDEATTYFELGGRAS